MSVDFNITATDFFPTDTEPFETTSLYTTLFSDDLQSTPKSTGDRPPTPGPDDEKKPPPDPTGERPPTPGPDVTRDDGPFQTWDPHSTYPWIPFNDTKEDKEDKEEKEEKNNTKPCSKEQYVDANNSNSTVYLSPCDSNSDAFSPEKVVGRPAIHSEMLLYKQSLGVGSLVFMFTLIVFALLQIPMFKQCWPSFKKQQVGNKSGKILFGLFLIALALFLLNSGVFTYFIFHLQTLSDDAYATLEVLAFVPYRLGKLVMHLFFIFRLQFVFIDSPWLQLNKCTLYSLITLVSIGTILGCISSVVGPFKLIHHSPDADDNAINPALLIGFISLGISIVVDIVVMLFYNQRLRRVVIMQGEVSRKSISIRSPRKRTRSMVTTETTRSRTEVVELQKPRKSQSHKPGKSGSVFTYHFGDGEQDENHHRVQPSGTLNILPMTPVTERWDDHENDGETGTDRSREEAFPEIAHCSQAGNDTPCGDDDELDDELEWEDIEVVQTQVSMDKLLLATISKSTLLNLIGILTSFWLHVEMLVMAIRDESDGVLLRAIASFDGGINIICMYLVFAFAKPYYDIGCRCCHVVLEKCCTSATRKAVLRTKSVTHT